MAKEGLTLHGSMYPTHDSPHVSISFEFEQPVVQGKKLQFRPLSLVVSRVSEHGPMFSTTEQISFNEQPMVIALSATAHICREELQVVGAMSLSPHSLSNGGQHYWEWELTKSDVERIQQRNYHDRDIPFYLQVAGTIGVTLPDKGVWLFGIQGSNQFQIPRTTWNDYLHAVGYGGKFPENMNLIGVMQGDTPWDNAVKQLTHARSHLRHGHTYAALESCLSVIEKELPAPYHEAAWRDFLTMRAIRPDSKVDAIAKMFAGIGTYLNKVGHHFSRQERNEHTGELIRPPLDAYEAELLIGMSHLMITYLERLKELHPLPNVAEQDS